MTKSHTLMSKEIPIPATGYRPLARSLRFSQSSSRAGLAGFWSISISVFLFALSVVGGRAAQPAIVTPAVTNVVTDAGFYSQVLGSVVLKGISGLPSKRLALLNNRTVGTGEEID